MIHHCSYCNTPFTALRKDKQYCSHSCKQMAFMKRQGGSVGFVFPKHQNVNTLKRQVNEASNGQVIDEINSQYVNDLTDENANSFSLFSNDDVLDSTNNQSTNTESKTSIDYPIVKRLIDEQYIPVKCKWIHKIYERFNERGNDEKFNSPDAAFKDKINQVQWVSIHYRCLLECVITISEMKVVEWADLAELTNVFTFLIVSVYFKELPENYPYSKDIISLRDKLKYFCLETNEEEYVQFSLKFETKKELFLQRFELSLVFPKISFNQLTLDFNIENNKQISNLKEDRRIKQSLEEKPWRKKYKD